MCEVSRSGLGLKRSPGNMQQFTLACQEPPESGARLVSAKAGSIRERLKSSEFAPIK